MKKLKFLWTICALLCLGASNVWADKTIYLNPGVWNTGGARFALYMFVDNTTNAWTSFTEINGSGIYKATLSDTYPYMIIVRMDGSTNENNWDNDWNQTADITSGITDNQIYTITGWGDGNSPYSTSSPAAILSDDDASFSAGKYLFRNVATGKYLAPANDWGTRASLVEPTYYNTITISDGIYRIESQIENGSPNHFLGINGSGELYLDNSGSSIHIKEYNSTGTYVMSLYNDISFIGYDGSNTTLVHNLLDPSSANARWEIVSVNDASAVSTFLSGATTASPKDATFKIGDANFDARSRFSWSGTSMTKSGNDHNYNIQMYDGTFNMYQALTGLPNGIYKLTCQGFYRPGGNNATDATTRNAVLYAGSQTSRLMNINTGAQKWFEEGENKVDAGYTYNVDNSGYYAPNNQTDASTVFSAGDYANNSLYVKVTDGTLTIGVKKEAEVSSDWTCFDNFRLYYYGNPTNDPADLTFMINNPSFETGTMTGWLTVKENNVVAPSKLSDTGVKPVASYTLTNSDGNYIMNYYGWSWSWNATYNGIKQIIPDLPAGKYRIEAVIGGWNQWDNVLDVNGESQSQTMTANDTGVQYSVDVELDTKDDLTIIAKTYHTGNNAWEACFFKADNFRLYSLDNYYEELNAAIIAAEAKTLGFDDGEYAPYNNVDAITALNTAKAIYDDQSTYYSWSSLQTALSDLTGAEWTANVGEVDAFNDGDFSECDEDAGTPLSYTPNGWTASDNMRRMLKNSTTYPGLTAASATTAMMSWAGGATYGETTGYTMPLNANTVYELKFKAAGWNGEDRSGITVSVLNSSDGLNTTNLGTPDRDIEGKTISAGMTSYSKLFTTGAAGDYVFHIGCNDGKNFVFTDLELKKATATVIDEDMEEEEYSPVAGLANVTLKRTIKANTWNTFCVPFDISNAELKAAFGSDVKIAQYSAKLNDDGIHTDISFTKMDNNEDAVSANTPVLLKTSTAGTSYNFPGRTIETDDAVVEGEDGSDYDFVGSYKKKFYIPADDYYISSNTLYRATEDKTYIRSTRAYVHAKTANARIGGFFIDEEETTAIEGLTIEPAIVKTTGKIYNLQGQEVKSVRKGGIYIQNGRKMIK